MGNTSTDVLAPAERCVRRAIALFNSFLFAACAGLIAVGSTWLVALLILSLEKAT